MGKRLIVAEKHSVGKDIAKVLGCREKVDGALCGEHDIVTWAFGHLLEQCYPEDMDDKYKEWNMADLPIFPEPFRLKVTGSGEKQFDIIKGYMNDPQVDSIVCATDAGREGELIFRYIYQMAGCSKPVERLWISSLTYSAIKKGFEGLKSASEYDDLYESARCRSEADWLVGINGSRAFAIANSVWGLSVGRVLSPTLAILVRRERERRDFVPEEFCEVIASFDGWDGRLVNPETQDDPDTWSRFAKAREPELKQFAAPKQGEATVSEVSTSEEQIPPQQLYDLTSLQRDANRIYGYSSKFTLDTAQKLYERHKAITYPRTDSRFLSSDIKSTLNKRLESLCNGALAPYAKQAMESERDLFGRFILNKGVSDHHAIIPTGEAKNMEKWSKAEKQIFDLIAGRFVGMFLPDKHVLHQEIRTVIDDKEFRSFGEKVLEAGWSAADRSRTSGQKELPLLEKGEGVTVKSVIVREDATKPPVPHTEASLLNAMEHAGTIIEEESLEDHESEFGIGTPATRAATIEKLVEKMMITRKGRALIPTAYGMQLVEILPEYLQSPEMTGEWEARLARISKGTDDPDAFMAGIRELTTDLVKYADAQGDTGIKDADVVGTCPVCGQKVRDYPEAYYCENQECGFRRIWKMQKGFHPMLNAETMKQLLKSGKAETEKGTFKLTKDEPYIAFERAEKPEPQLDAFYALIDEYGLEPVDKTASGGALWFRGDWGDALMTDFVAACSEVGCELKFSKDAKALKHKSGWFFKVDVQAEQKGSQEPAGGTVAAEAAENEDPVLKLIEASGLPYADKRPKGGSLWFIAGEEEGKKLAEQCAQKGATFKFSEKGGKATGKKPGWYWKG